MDKSKVRHSAVSGEPVIDPAGWIGSEIAKQNDWLYQLNAAEISDLIAVASLIRKRIGNDPNGLLGTTRKDFNLGVFSQTLERIKHELKDGKGFVLIRGLPLDKMSLLDAAIIYWAIGRMLGTAVSNNPNGDMIGHVTDMGKDINHPQHRPYQTSATMDYHTDQCPVVGLLCVQTAKSGGVSKIASSIAVYNELLQSHPDLIPPLTRPFCWSKLGEIDPGESPYYESPVFNFIEGYLSTSFGPNHIIKGHRLAETPDMTAKQREALEMVEAICEKQHLAMNLERGDIQLVNNLVVMHSRSGFEDWPEPERKRRLWRLWLEIPGIRPLTPFQQYWRGGLKLKQTKERIVLE